MKKLKWRFKDLNRIPGMVFRDYYATYKGEIISTKTGNIKVLKTQRQGKGYRSITLHYNSIAKTYQVHRLVLAAFKGWKKDKFCNHKDGNKANNNISNLEWVTRKENAQHSLKNGLHKVGEDSCNAKVTENDVVFMRELFKAGYRVYELVKIFGINSSSVSNICQNKQWRHIK